MIVFLVTLISARPGHRCFGTVFFLIIAIIFLIFYQLVHITPTLVDKLPAFKGCVAPLLKMVWIQVVTPLTALIWKKLYKPGINCFLIVLLAGLLVVVTETYGAFQFLVVGNALDGIIFSVSMIVSEINLRSGIMPGLLWWCCGMRKYATFSAYGMNIRRCKLACSYCWLVTFIPLALISYLLGVDNVFREGKTWLRAFCFVFVQFLCDFGHVFSQRLINPQPETWRQTYTRLLQPNGTVHFLGPQRTIEPSEQDDQTIAQPREETEEESLDIDLRCLNVPTRTSALFYLFNLSFSIARATMVAVFGSCGYNYRAGLYGDCP
jgi:hypothetical protein